MLNRIAFFIILAITSVGFIACNESSDEPEEALSSNVMVTSFSLEANDSILENLDSVFFTIDLVNAKIYNTDSLPFGTNISKLAVNIGTTGSSVAELTISRPGESDSIVDYLKNSTYKVDFSNGPIKLHLVALDGTAQRDYSISVNVHTVKPDSLYWNKLSLNILPSTFTNPSVQKTVLFKEKAFCLTGVDNIYSIATSENPTTWRWNKSEVEFPFIPNINSLNVTPDALYILDNENNLYSSTNGTEWSSCNTKWHHIYGAYGEILLGVKKIEDKFYHVTYPETTEVLAQDDCPVSGTSQTVSYTSEWSNNSQLFLIGGRCANGSLSGYMWGFDGSTWTKISQTQITPREGMTFFEYYTFDTNTENWSVTEYPTLIAFGGFDAEGYPDNKVYTSIDMGLNWKVADDLMQFPEYIPGMGYSQVLIFNKTMTSRSSSFSWIDYPSKELPSWFFINERSSTRAVQAPTQWECPYIYLFGGYDKNGKLYNTVWRGVINRLSFKPLI